MDGFTQPTVRRAQGDAFDASQYSFFGPVSDALAGSLEDGLEGPPEEERLLSAEEEELPLEDEMDMYEDDADLSLAAVFQRQQLQDAAGEQPRSQQAALDAQAPAAPPPDSMLPMPTALKRWASGAGSQTEPSTAITAVISPSAKAGAAPAQAAPSAPGPPAVTVSSVQASPVAALPPLPALPTAGALTAEQLEARIMQQANQQKLQQPQQPQQQPEQQLRPQLPQGALQAPGWAPPGGGFGAHGTPAAAGGRGPPMHPFFGMAPRPGMPPFDPSAFPMPPAASMGPPGPMPMRPMGPPLMPMGPPRPGMPPGAPPNGVILHPHLPPPMPFPGGPPGAGPMGMGPPGAPFPGVRGVPPGFPMLPGMGPPGGMGPMPMGAPPRPGMPPVMPGAPGFWAGAGPRPGGVPPPMAPGGQLAVRPADMDLAPSSAAPRMAPHPAQPGPGGTPPGTSPSPAAAAASGPPLAAGPGRGPPAPQLQSSGGYSHYPPAQKRWKAGLLMSEEDINFVLRIQFAATHGGSPYVEDYYHQAYLFKYSGGRNANVFVPEGLRSLDGSNTQHAPGASPAADLVGLGTFVLSNIRTPKMLMDLRGSSSAAAGSSNSPGVSQQKMLEQEPMLAARIMIEDCMDFLLDIDDVDRVLASARGRQGAAGLRNRRSALLGSILNSFRLPQTPDGSRGSSSDPQQEQGRQDSVGDGVLQQVAVLPKGRALLAKTLRLLFAGAANNSSGKAGTPGAGSSNGSPGSSPGLVMVWAVFRNALQLFGPAMSATRADARVIDSSVLLSEAVADVVKRLQQPSDAVQCLTAFNTALHAPADAQVPGRSAAHDPLLPLYPAGRVAADVSPLWLDHMLAALLLRASELGLGSFAMLSDDEAAAPAELADAWEQQLALLYSAYINHLQALSIMLQQEQQVTADSAQLVKKLASPSVMRGLLAHCSKEQEEQLRSSFAAATR